MKYILILPFLFLLACDRHKMWSSVQEKEKLSGVELSQAEELNKAYLDRNYEDLQALFEGGVDVDLVVSQGKTLLFKSVEDKRYKMADFLVKNSADPYKEIAGYDEYPTAMALAESLAEDLKFVFINILEGNLHQVSQMLFFETIASIDTGGQYDMEWLELLHNSGVIYIYLGEEDFNKYFIKIATLSANYQDLYAIIFSDLSRIPVNEWLDWAERPFVSGRYSHAKCDLDELPRCVTFESFLQSCPSKMHGKLERARDKIIPYLQIRNGLLDCGHEAD